MNPPPQSRFLSATELEAAVAAAPLFEGLAPTRLTAIAARCRTAEVEAGGTLFRRGTPSSGFYLVRTGLMQLTVSNSEGAVKVLEILAAGSSFGQAAMLLGKPFPVDATALEDSTLVFVPHEAVDELLDSDPEMARIMLASMARRLQAKVQDIAMLSLKSAAQRIVAYLLGAAGSGSYDLGDGSKGYARNYSVNGAHGVELPVLKSVLASRLGMTAETFSRALRSLSESGLVRIEGNRILIDDIDALAGYPGGASADSSS